LLLTTLLWPAAISAQPWPQPQQPTSLPGLPQPAESLGVHTYRVPHPIEQVHEGVVVTAGERSLSFGVAGRVESIDVSVGERVDWGSVVARLHRDQLEMDLMNARAELAMIQSTVEELAVEFDEVEVRVNAGDATAAQLEEVQLELAEEMARTVPAQHRVTEAESRLEAAELTVSRPSVVTAVHVSPEDEVRADTPIVSLADADAGAVLVELTVLDTAVTPVATGDSVTVRAHSLPDVELGGRVVEITPDTAGGAHVVVQLDGTDPRLRNGMTAEIRLAGDAPAQGLRLPRALLMEGDGETVVYALERALDGSMRVHPLPVTVSDSGDGSMVEVTGGVSPGALLVAPSLPPLSEGQAVEVLGPSPLFE
jgi:RND family efflux transporter MFP subunit